MKIKPFETIAKLLTKAFQGVGTKYLLLCATIIRYQMAMGKVMEAYEELYGQKIRDVVKKEVAGDFERLLVELCDAAA